MASKEIKEAGVGNLGLQDREYGVQNQLGLYFNQYFLQNARLFDGSSSTSHSLAVIHRR